MSDLAAVVPFGLGLGKRRPVVWSESDSYISKVEVVQPCEVVDWNVLAWLPKVIVLDIRTDGAPIVNVSVRRPPSGTHAMVARLLIEALELQERSGTVHFPALTYREWGGISIELEDFPTGQSVAGRLTAASSSLLPADEVPADEVPARELDKVAKDPDTDAVVAALADPRWDFRTVSGIVRSTGLQEDVVRRILADLGDAVRGPVVPDPAGRDLYTLSSRPPRRREKWLHLRALLTRSLG
jgi:hypothetical protein